MWFASPFPRQLIDISTYKIDLSNFRIHLDDQRCDIDDIWIDIALFKFVFNSACNSTQIDSIIEDKPLLLFLKEQQSQGQILFY